MNINDIINLLINLPIGKLSKYFDSKEITCGSINLPIILRLDGVSFGTRLSNFKWPRDENVHNALLNACEEVIKFMGADFGFVISDEILVFFLNYLPYGGRVFKLISISSGIASSIISMKLGKELFFDSRIIKIENVNDVIEYIYYRARVGLNNYLGSIAAKLKIFEKGYTPSIDVLVNTLKQYLKPDENWKYLGTGIIRERSEKEAIDKISGNIVHVSRKILKRCTLPELLTYVQNLITSYKSHNQL